ncbi:MAG: hypothetical protein HY773_01115 [Candidatus Terrybacteria bacterium]|nr:hypothetical protein [Candidatus Terrybacteria bacterium]
MKLAGYWVDGKNNCLIKNPAKSGEKIKRVAARENPLVVSVPQVVRIAVVAVKP